MIRIITAFKEEANPFIETLSLKVVSSAKDYPLYRSRQASLIISGMGVRNAAAAAQALVAQFPAAARDRWLNFGIAGSAEFQPGTAVVAAAVQCQDSGGYWDCDCPAWIDLPRAVVRTVPRPETRYADSGVYDMEAAGVMALVYGMNENARVTCIKLVTDGPDNPVSQLKISTIGAMIRQIGPDVAGWIEGKEAIG